MYNEIVKSNENTDLPEVPEVSAEIILDTVNHEVSGFIGESSKINITNE